MGNLENVAAFAGASDAHACRRMESKVGNVLDTSMHDIFMGADMENDRDFDKFEKRDRCELRGFCRGRPAVSHSYTGNMYAPGPQRWKEISI